MHSSTTTSKDLQSFRSFAERSLWFFVFAIPALVVSSAVYPVFFSIITWDAVALGPFFLTTALGLMVVGLTFAAELVLGAKYQQSVFQFPGYVFAWILLIQIIAAVDRVMGVYSPENAFLIETLGASGATVTLIAISSFLAIVKAMIFYIASTWARQTMLHRRLLRPRQQDLDYDPSLAKFSATNFE